MKTVNPLFFAVPLALVATVISNAPSQAQSLTFANKVESYNAGYATTSGGKVTKIEDGRDNPEEALGAFTAPTGNVYSSGNQKFLSLGLGGSAVFSFGTLFQNQIRLWETTWGFKSSQEAYDEQVDVYVGNSLDSWNLVQTVKNIADGAYNTKTGTVVNLKQGETYQFVKLVDKSARGNDRDGWDISAIAVESAPTSAAAAPEPTTMAGLALAGMGMSIARRKAKKLAQ